jgi:hypothetical protein
MKIITLITGLFFSSVAFMWPQPTASDFPKLTGPYLGQKPPGMTPELFAPGIISKGYDERGCFFTPDGKECFYQLRGAPHTVIVHTEEVNGMWTQPEIAFFSGKYFSEFSLSPYGNKIVYCSNQPENDQGPTSEQWRTWIVERTKTGWSKPRDLRIESAYPTISTKGNIYFFLYRNGRTDVGQIYMSTYYEVQYSAPVDISNMGSEINTDAHEVDPFIAPDESYLIFASNRPGGYGDADLYICFRKDDVAWTKARNMGPSINTKACEICPSVTPDGKYFFFSNNLSLFPNYSEKRITYSEKERILNSPGNGNFDIYWVDAKIIEELRTKELK